MMKRSLRVLRRDVEYRPIPMLRHAEEDGDVGTYVFDSWEV